MSKNTLDLWLDGTHAGQLMRAESGNVEFRYREEYRTLAGATPLSVSMPLSRQAHGPKQVMPWLSNLLPDSDKVRHRWAAQFHERRSDPFTLLRHVGKDAPGSVQVMPLNIAPSQTGELRELTDTEIAERIQAIHSDPSLWVEARSSHESSFSLGGHQGKFAIAQRDGVWYEPTGRMASTHIVKPGMSADTGKTQEEMQAVEFVTMRASKELGIPTAHVEIRNFNGTFAFITSRYDRITHSDGTVTRLHQEDFCQTLSVNPARKYESDGGPTMRDMMSVVEKFSSPVYKDRDLNTLRALFAFNLASAGVDAHAKNSSLLLRGSHALLAPAYDLISAHGLWPSKEVMRKHGPAVKYGKAGKYLEISARNVARTADTLGMMRNDFNALLHEMADQLPEVYATAADALPPSLHGMNVQEMPAQAQAFNQSLISGITDKALAETPRFAAHSNTSSSGLQPPEEYWVGGHLRNGDWVEGHYTKTLRR